MRFICCIILQAKWLSEERVYDRNTGDFVFQATGSVCLIDGTTCEVWPLEEKHDIIARCGTYPAFKKDFALIRVGVEKALSKNIPRPEHVVRDNVTGLRFYRTQRLFFCL